MMSDFSETEVVELTEDVCQDDIVLPRGTRGTVIAAGRVAPNMYLVEIVKESGDSFAEVAVSASQIRPYLLADLTRRAETK